MIATPVAASLLAAAAAAALAGAQDPSPPPEIRGSVFYRERVALPADAVVHVRLELAAAPEMPARRVAEVTIPVEGREVPIPFVLPYDASAIQKQKRYLVRATITAGDKMLFVSRSSYPVITGGASSRADILVEPAGSSLKARPTGSTTRAGLAGTEWTLVALGDAPSEAAGGAPPKEPPTLRFEGAGKRISGSTGCNRFFGTFSPGDGDGLKLEPAGMTLMACPDEVSRREKAFLEALRTTTAYRRSGEALELLGGDRVLARFEPLRKPTPTH